MTASSSAESDRLKNHILVVEDDDLVRELVLRWLQEDGHLCTGMERAKQALDFLERDEVPLVLSDIRMPGMDGLQLLEKIHQDHPDTAVVMFTACDDLDYAWRAKQLGAFGYILKPLSKIEVIFNVNNALRFREKLLLEGAPSGDSLPPAQLADKAGQVSQAWELNKSGWALFAPDRTKIPLTAMELKLLLALCEAPGEPVDRYSLMERLYPRQDEYSSKALNALVKRLRIKIVNETQGAPPIQTSYGTGYCFSDPVLVR